MEQRPVRVTLAVAVVALIIGSVYMAIASIHILGLADGGKHDITVSGSGSVTLAPDQAQVNLGAMTQASTAQEASSMNSQIINNLLGRLRSLGIANDSISTASYSIFPMYSNNPNTPNTVVGYQVRHLLEIKIQNSDVNRLSDKIGQVIDVSVSAGANQVSGIQFTLSNTTMRKTNTQALQRATQDAASKANVIASSLGLKIAGVISVKESLSSPPIYLASAQSAASTPILPSTLTVTASVEITYAV